MSTTIGKLIIALLATAVMGISTSQAHPITQGNAKQMRMIVTSDTILAGMITSLLPPDRYAVASLLPPGQCPGHYDVKLRDIEKVKNADLIVAFTGMPFMDKTGHKAHILVDTEGRNWMAPDSYIHGLGVIADALSKQFPSDRPEIEQRKITTIRRLKAGIGPLMKKMKLAGFTGKSVIASSMQKEPLAWMGFRVAGEYGRPEAMSGREVVRLADIGKKQHAAMVVDNLQSGPDAGKGIAETLAIPHVVLTNFPSEKGYFATLQQNIDVVMAAMKKK